MFFKYWEAILKMNSFVPDEVCIKPDIFCPGSEIQARFRLRLPRPSDWAANFCLWYKQKQTNISNIYGFYFSIPQLSRSSHSTRR